MIEYPGLPAVSGAIRGALDNLGVELTWEQCDTAAEAVLEVLRARS